MARGKLRSIALVVGAAITAVFVLCIASVGRAASAYPSTVLADQPWGYWRLDESSGTIAHDATGNNHDLTVDTRHWYGTPLWGRVGPRDDGTALELRGNPASDEPGDRVYGGNSQFYYTLVDNLTAELWVNPGPSTFGFQFLIGAGNPVRRFSTGWGLMKSNDNNLELWVNGDQVLTGPNLPVGSWSYVAVTRENGVWSIYKDGVAATGTATQAPVAPDDFYFGADIWDRGGFNFKGLIADGALYTHALSPAQILAHYDAASQPAPPSGTLSLSGPDSALVGATQIVTAQFEGTGVPTGTQVDFQVEGVNPTSGQTPLDGSGTATFNYEGGFEGIDRISATLMFSNTTFASSPLSVAWRYGRVTSYPGASLSFYQDGIKPQDLIAQGRDAAALLRSRPRGAPRIAVVVLDWGLQEFAQGSGWRTVTPDHPYKRSMAAIRIAMQSFADGFFRGSASVPAARLVLVAGTNNDNDALMISNATEAGREWGRLVNQLRSILAAKPQSGASVHWSDRISIIGGIDLESGFCPGAPCVEGAKRWIEGYDETTAAMLVNFGSCNGCDPSLQRGNNNWTFSDYISMNTKHNVFTIPQIYATFPAGGTSANAIQWGTDLNAAVPSGSRKIIFLGAMSTHTACHEPDPVISDAVRCHKDNGDFDPSTDNTCQQAWDSLWRKAEQLSLPFSTDIAHDLHSAPRAPC